MYDGIELIGDFAGDIDIGDLCDEAIGEITDQVADLDIPDIDFGEFQDVLGDLFGDIGDFAQDAGQDIADNIGDMVGDLFS